MRGQEIIQVCMRYYLVLGCYDNSFIQIT